MISMTKVNDIRRMRREGESVASIARKVGVCRDTVYKYLAMDDLSPKMPAKSESAPVSLTGRYQATSGWLAWASSNSQGLMYPRAECILYLL